MPHECECHEGARAQQTSAWRRTHVDVIREHALAEAREVTCTFTYGFKGLSLL